MSNIRVDVGYTIKDGAEIKFRSPVDCSQVTGLIVYYPGADGNTTSKEFAFADAHGNNVGDIDHLFAENVVVKVILDVTTGMAFVQNADTNAYLEGHIQSKNNPHGVTAEQIGAVAKSELKVLAYSNTDENGDTTAASIKSYPTTPGVFRVVEPVAGLPSGSLGYGTLVIFDGGSYWLHLYQDVEGYLYWARTANSTTDNSVNLPNASSWHRSYDNVNKPTASDVGAVPAGYGYGESLTYISKTDTDGTNLENYLDSNFVLEQNKLKVFRFSNLASYPDCVISNLGGYADLHVASANYCELVGYFYTEHGGVSVARKLKTNGTWYPWEYENPPMVFGVEYRTTERWNGYAVYTKLVDLGIVPVGERDIDIGFFAGLIRHYAVTNTNRSVLDTGTTVGEWDVSVKIFQDTVRVTGGESIGNNNELLYLQLWYVKP